MHWILLAVLAGVLVATASRFPKLAFSLLALMVAVAAALYHLTDTDGQGGLKPLDPAQVKVDGIRMSPYYADGFKASGKITNNSPEFDVTELSIRFSVEDCIVTTASDTGDECSIVAQLVESIRLHIPPGATRGFEQPVFPRRIAVQGERRWTFKVVDVTGRRPLRLLDGE